MTARESAHSFPAEPHGRTEPAEHHAVPYARVCAALAALTLATLAVANKRFDNEWVNVSAALLIAAAMATFVARYFMRLKFEGTLFRLILAVPVVLAVILVLGLIPDIGNGSTHRLLRPPIEPGIEVFAAR